MKKLSFMLAFPTRSSLQEIRGAVRCVLASMLATTIALTTTLLHAHEEPRRTPIAARYAPTVFPDRLVLTWAGDPTNSVDVTWRTNLETTKGIAEYAPAANLLGDIRAGDYEGKQTVSARGERFASNAGEATMHSCRLTDLEPATLYAYRVGNGEHWSEWHQFRTAAAEPAPFTFVYFGDAQNSVRSLWSRVVREANQHAPRADFMLHAGDLINRANNDHEWGEWFEAGGWINGMIPVVATPGNHEYRRGQLSRHWRPQFALPENGPAGLEESAYWFDYQGARIISLNSNEQVERQTPWLKKVLADPERPKWTIATFHHPIYSAARNRDNPELRQQWRSVLEETGVDLVLTGHDHAYARSGLGGPENLAEGVRTKQSNTVYVVSVSGPKQYPLQETWDVERVAAGVQLFQVIRVSQEKILYEARLATGELYDAFELTKNGAGESTLTEQVPPRPEIREP